MCGWYISPVVRYGGAADGKMKSREGTVVDADDMVAEMVSLAKEQTEEAGKTEGFYRKNWTTI